MKFEESAKKSLTYWIEVDYSVHAINFVIILNLFQYIIDGYKFLRILNRAPVFQKLHISIVSLAVQTKLISSIYLQRCIGLQRLWPHPTPPNGVASRWLTTSASKTVASQARDRTRCQRFVCMVACRLSIEKIQILSTDASYYHKISRK